MAESIQEVFWLLSADRQPLLYVSLAFETIWGRPLESLYIELNAHLNVMMDSIHPSDKEQVIAAFAPLGIILCNAQGRLLRSNQAFQELLGYTEPELQNLTFIEFTHPDEQAESLNLFQASWNMPSLYPGEALLKKRWRLCLGQRIRFRHL